MPRQGHARAGPSLPTHGISRPSTGCSAPGLCEAFGGTRRTTPPQVNNPGVTHDPWVCRDEVSEHLSRVAWHAAPVGTALVRQPSPSTRHVSSMGAASYHRRYSGMVPTRSRHTLARRRGSSPRVSTAQHAPTNTGLPRTRTSTASMTATPRHAHRGHPRLATPCTKRLPQPNKPSSYRTWPAKSPGDSATPHQGNPARPSVEVCRFGAISR